jgi:alpha-1,6-mannosyltransferase
VIVAVVIDLLRRLGQPTRRVVAYVWHPLPIWEVANNGHVDALMVAFMMGGIWLAIASGRVLWGAAVITLGALAKPFALLALPPLWRPFDWRMPLIVIAVAGLAYAPYLSVGTGVFGFLGSGYLAEERIDTGGGFWLLSVWRTLFGLSPHDASVYLALSLLVLSALALQAGFRRERTPASMLVDINRLLLVFLFLLSPDYPWYFLMAVPFLALLGGAPGWVLTVGGFMLYDVVTGDPQIPFSVRDAAFNGLFLAATAFMWLRPRSPAIAEVRT